MPEEVRADLLLGRDTLSPGLVKAGKAASDASGNVRQLTRDLYEAGKVRATPVVDLQDATATAKLKDVSQKLRDLGTKVADPQIDVKDKAAVASVAAMRVKLDQLGRQVSSPRVTLEGLARAEAGILTLDLALDKLSAKTATPDVSSGGGGILGKLSGLFGGGGGSSGGGAGAGGSAASGGGILSGGLTSPPGIAAIAGGSLLAAGSIPGLVGAGIGGGVGLGAIAGGLFGAAQGTKVLKADTATIKQITTGLKTAIGSQRKILSADLVAANKQFAKDSNFFAPFLGFQKSLKDLLQVFLAPLRSVMAPLTQIFAQFGKGLTLLAPLMTQMFKASLPFIRQFLTVMLQAGKILIPAFTQAMTEMVKSGALKEMTQGLVYLVQGLAGFVVALGPGMKASAQIFERICLVLKGAMIGLGVVVSAVANILEFNFPKAIDKMRHETAVIFDGLRHDVSSIWDKMWANTFGRLQRGVADDQRLVANFRHAVAGTFDGLRHDIAAAWDRIWSNTVARVQRGIADVVRWFKGLPGKAVGALFGLGHSLAAFASAAIGQMWTGFKNTFSAVIHWFTGLPRMILHALGIKSPPGWAISAGKFIMQGLHIGLGHGLGQLTSFTTGIGAKVAAGLSGAVGVPGNVKSYTPEILHALALLGQPASDLGVVLSQMTTESGGHPTIVNRTDSNWLAGHPSVGLMQVIRGTFDAYAGPYRNTGPFEYGVSTNPMANIFAGLNYAVSRYGAGWPLVLGHGHGYDQGGWLMPGLTLAVNKTGKPERVLPPGHSGAATQVVLQVRAPHGATNLERALVEIIQKFVTVQGGDVQSALGRT